MSATRLLVLAFVRAHGRAHGYAVSQDLLAWNADKWANTKTGSIYHALRQLAKYGLLRATEVDATDDNPARTDYEITPAGESEFQKLIETALTRPDPRPDMFCAGLVLMPALSRQTVISYLKRRHATLLEHNSSVIDASGNAQWTGAKALPPHVESLLSFWTHHTSCSADWVAELLAKIENGAYIFCDDDPSVFGTPGSNVSVP